ncbi:Oidioi.mRNA.OKI2018_I69.XSR.g14211.t1.cds [Oikopleura dioica]|uniref:Oidioi.mRNA.OKI2018_I69.XSR.g14211.t1.cds n=1 Tax=Oikopleura dioica TaxID=34765 RepID=A0ABN7SED5_OIKDI|nr:Oidioi.mRNA.OKI2018_I69.XSR.g14211.t1.cds [Oikopleura dioica]
MNMNRRTRDLALLSSMLYQTAQAQYDNDDEDFEGSGSGDFGPSIPFLQPKSHDATEESLTTLNTNVKDEPENAGSEDYSVIMYAGIAVAALFVVVGAIAFIRHRKKDDGEYTKGDKA